MLSTDETEQLRLFVFRAEQLLASRMLRGGFDAGFSINFDRQTGLRFTATEPDEEDLRSFMLTFRQFTSPNEPVHLAKVCNLLEQRLNDAELREAVRGIRAEWKSAQRVGLMAVNIDSRDYKPEHVLDLFVNGYYFHNDAAKRDLLNSLGPVGQFLARRQFLNLVVDGVRVIGAVSHVITSALEAGSFA